MPNKEQKQPVSDVNSFIKVIESVDIQVNYKDKIFLAQTKKYKGYVSEQLKTISFSDIKMDLENVKLISSLEDKYRSSKKVNALRCNELMEDCVKDAKVRIAEAFVGFMDEVIKVRKSIKKISVDVYLRKTNNKTMCLVYKDGVYDPSKSKQDYQFAKLDDLLQTIANVTVEYCKAVEGKKIPTVPMFIRQSCVLVCYALIDFGDYVSKGILRKPIAASTGVQKQIMDDLSRRCTDLGYPYFAKSDKLFQYDKWSISPETAIHKDSYIAPMSPVKYAGSKEGYLGYMINQLQRQVPHSVFLDAFGGSGISSVQFPHQDGVEYFVNDYDFTNVCYYWILKSSDEIFSRFLEKLDYVRSVLLDAYKIYEAYDEKTKNKSGMSDEGKAAKIRFDIVCDAYYGLFKEAVSVSCDNLKVWRLLNKSLKDFCPCTKDNFNEDCRPLIDVLKVVYGDDYILPDNLEDMWSGNVSRVDIAVVYTVFYNFLASGSASPTNRPGGDLIKTLVGKDFTSTFKAIREAYRDINIISDVGADAMKLLDEDCNRKEVLAYLDSPYTGTSTYSVNKADNSSPYKKGTVVSCNDFGNDYISNDFDMKDLMEKCKKYKGKFIFSCRANMVRKNCVYITSGTETLTEFGERKKVAMPYAVYNNYLWFMRQWLDTSYNVLFMVNKDLKMEESSCSSFNKESKDRVLSADWGMDISAEDKEYVYNFLRLKIMTGYDLELMITNFDYEVPDFYNMFEHIENYYDKKSHSVLWKQRAKNGLIPINGMFCKMPVKLLADIAYTELYAYNENVGDWIIK